MKPTNRRQLLGARGAESAVRTSEGVSSVALAALFLLMGMGGAVGAVPALHPHPSVGCVYPTLNASVYAVNNPVTASLAVTAGDELVVVVASVATGAYPTSSAFNDSVSDGVNAWTAQANGRVFHVGPFASVFLSQNTTVWSATAKTTATLTLSAAGSATYWTSIDGYDLSPAARGALTVGPVGNESGASTLPTHVANLACSLLVTDEATGYASGGAPTVTGPNGSWTHHAGTSGGSFFEDGGWSYGAALAGTDFENLTGYSSVSWGTGVEFAWGSAPLPPPVPVIQSLDWIAPLGVALILGAVFLAYLGGRRPRDGS